MPFSVGPMELAIVLIVALVILGPKRLPGAARSLGRGMREFKDSLTGREPEAAHAHELDAAAPAPSEHA
jgi:sec-independent protein translocase protein TatA